jgi:hypothetical protein
LLLEELQGIACRRETDQHWGWWSCNVHELVVGWNDKGQVLREMIDIETLQHVPGDAGQVHEWDTMAYYVLLSLH